MAKCGPEPRLCRPIGPRGSPFEPVAAVTWGTPRRPVLPMSIRPDHRPERRGRRSQHDPVWSGCRSSPCTRRPVNGMPVVRC